MPTLLIPFPEKETPSLVELRGSRITVGRLADNTIQIRDRTVSAHHAELVDEGDHYRLHDCGSTNGVTVDGKQVTDFHLQEGCKIAFGAVECVFDPAPVPVEVKPDPTKALVTRVECETLIRENAELKERLATMSDQIEKLQAAHAAEADGPGVPQVDFDKVVAEVSALKETLLVRDREVEKLQGHLALLRRDHGRLQHALEETRGAAQPAAPAPAPAAPKPEAPTPAPASPPSAPSAPPPGLGEAPIFVRATSPGGAAQPEQPSPARPLPKPPEKLQPAASAGTPAAKPAIPVKPFPPAEKPAVPTPPAPKSKPGLPVGSGIRPTATIPVVKPAPAKPVPVKPVAAVKVVPATPAPSAGPKGTQKLQA